MSEKKISYTNRTYEQYRESLKNIANSYFPDIADKFDDASVGSFFIDLAAAIGDNLGFHMDRILNETNLDSAQEKSSVYAIARTNGLKVPGPKASIAEEKFSCYLPVSDGQNLNNDSTVGIPSWTYAPVLKKGTKLSSGSQFFELLEDLDFGEQFDEDGNSNRNIIPQKDSNGKISSYLIEKYAPVYGGETKVYKQILTKSDIVPNMEIVIPDSSAMNIESVIFKAATNLTSDPSMAEFMNPNEYIPADESPYNIDTYRFFEVNSLIEQYRWGDDITSTKGKNKVCGKTEKTQYGYVDGSKTIPVSCVVKGEWVPLTQKFITEFTDNGYIKLIFGSGECAGQEISEDVKDFTKWQMSKMIRNDFLGKLPQPGWTMYVQYRTGGGKASNVAAGTINNIVYLNAEIGKCPNADTNIISSVRNSLFCTNTTPSVSGKDAPTVDEIKSFIKYNSGAQERCITLKDYVNRVLMMPPRYGCPFKIGAIEENNKVMLYLLGLNYDGTLTENLPSQLITNIENYLAMYRAINDFVEIKSGRVINISFEIDMYVDKNYNSSDVVTNVINTVSEYMDINKHELDDDIFIGDLEKEIGKVDGVINLIDVRVYNEFGDKYSSSQCSQETTGKIENNRAEIDLAASDYVLVSNADEMFEVKYPQTDIRCRVKTR